MAKKNMDILLGNILGKAAIHPQDRFDKSPGNPQEQQISTPNPQTESDSPVSGSAFIHCRLLIYSYLCTIILKSTLIPQHFDLTLFIST